MDDRYHITVPSMTNRIREFAQPDEEINYRFLDVIDTFCWTISTRQDRCPNAGIIKNDIGPYRI